MIIGLITDFGYKDPYVGVVKAVIKSINPRVEIIDVTHGVERHNVLEAAVDLLVSSSFFPPGSIFVVVVDPGVGSDRKALLVRTRNYILLGPDNGCLTLLIERDGFVEAYDISRSRYSLSRVSHTFHGRDIFAPVAAWVSMGIPIEEVGSRIGADSLVKLNIAKPVFRSDKSIETPVVYVDVFGNIMTFIDEKHLELLGLKHGDRIIIETKHGVWTSVFERSFSVAPPGSIVSYVNSWGYLEIAINKGDASRSLVLRTGDLITIKKGS